MAKNNSENKNEEVKTIQEGTENNTMQNETKKTTSTDADMTAPVKEQEEKVKIVIPKDQINKNDSFVPVAINGYIYQIKRGETVEVPKEVARILKEAGYIA